MRDTLRVTAEPLTDDRAFRCSVGALDESMAGSAAVATAYLLVEHPGPWGRKALAESRFPEHVRHGLAKASDAASVRVQLIRRPGRTDPSESFRVFASYADPAGPWSATAVLGDPERLLAVVLSARRHLVLPGLRRQRLRRRSGDLRSSDDDARRDVHRHGGDADEFPPHILIPRVSEAERSAKFLASSSLLHFTVIRRIGRGNLAFFRWASVPRRCPERGLY